MEYREKFLELALQRGVISVAGGRVFTDKTFGNSGELLGYAALACRQAMERIPVLREADVLVAFGTAQESLPLLAVAAQPFGDGAAKDYIHPAMRSYFDRSFLKGKKLVMLTMNESDLLPPAVQAFASGHGAKFLGTVSLFSERADQGNTRFDVSHIRVFCHVEILAHFGKLVEA